MDAFLADTSRRLRESRGSPAGFAPLRRALGPALARRRALRRHLRQRLGLSGAAGAPVSRLGHPRLQPRPALTISSSASRSPATCCGGSTDAERNERIIATGYLAIARRFRRRPHGRTLSHARGHDRQPGPGHAGLHHLVCPLPRSQVRPVHDERLLRSLRHLQQHALSVPRRRGRQGAGGFRAADVGRGNRALLKPTARSSPRSRPKSSNWKRAEAEAKKAPDGPDKKARVAAAAKALAEAKKQRAAILAEAPVIDNAYAVADGKPANAKIHLRGDPKRLGDEVPRHFPAVLGGQQLPNDCDGQRPTATGRMDHRREEPAHGPGDGQPHLAAPLRQGNRPDAERFRPAGKRPTHPELLDFLAARFIESGWSIKADAPADPALATWQLASTGRGERREARPEQRLVLEIHPPPAGCRSDPRHDALRERRTRRKVHRRRIPFRRSRPGAGRSTSPSWPCTKRAGAASISCSNGCARIPIWPSSTAPTRVPAPATGCQARRRCRRCS